MHLPGGRPAIVLTKEIEDALIKAAGEGIPMKRLHLHAGISSETLRRWMYSEEPEKRILSMKIRQMAACVESELVSKVRRGGQGWQAAAWLLERRFGWYAGGGTHEDIAPPAELTKEAALEKLRKIPADVLQAALRSPAAVTANVTAIEDVSTQVRSRKAHGRDSDE